MQRSLREKCMSSAFSLDFPFAYGQPNTIGVFRQSPEDFRVDEVLGYEPVGTGEHVYLHIRKRGENTAWVAEHIARLANVNVNDVGYCGRKDRHAVTTQWFSVYFPKGQAPDWQSLNSESVTVLQASRHTHKLRRGEHQLNRFVIQLRDCQVDDMPLFEQRLKQVFTHGVPNYFGEQRFGRDGNNLQQAQALLVEGKAIRDRQKRGLMLSAARSYLFNQVLATRVLQDNWTQSLSGDVFRKPTGPLWGRGRSQVSADTLFQEQAVLVDWQAWCEALEHVGLQQERRPLVLHPENSEWRWLQEGQGHNLEVSFALAAGEFATAVLREMMLLRTYASEDLQAS